MSRQRARFCERDRIALLRRLCVPVQREPQILGHAVSLLVHAGKDVLRADVASQGASERELVANAAGTLTFTGLPQQNDTVTIGGTTYQFVNNNINQDYHVHRGSTQAALAIPSWAP